VTPKHASASGRARRRGAVVGPSLVAGVGLALSLPPIGLWPIAFFAAALLWWRIGGLRLRTRLLAGFMAGLGLFLVGLWWTFSFTGLGAIVLIIVEALAPAVACAITPPRRGRAVGLAGAMVLFEAVRASWPFGGLPIGGVALGQAAGPIAGAARLGGPLLVVGLVWLGGAGLGLLVTAVAGAMANRSAEGREPAGWQDLAEHAAAVAGRETMAPGGVVTMRPWPVRGPVTAGLVCVAVVVAVAGWAAVAPDGGPALSTIRVAAVQGGGVRGLRKAQVNTTTVFDAQLAATAEIPAHDRGRPPTLVLWPEDVVSLDGQLTSSPVNNQLGALASTLRATLVVGVTETMSATTFRNEAVAYSPSGRLVARFEKVHRVPFGEYVPYRGFFSHIANLSAVPQDAIPGHGDGVLHTPAGALGTMISYEVFYAGRGWVATRAGARLLIVPTNTASYSTSQVPSQEEAADCLQAIDEGRDLVQAATTGYSTLVNNRGDVLAHTTLGQRQVLVVDAATRSGRTIYERVGDLAALVLAALAVIGAWIAQVTKVEVNEVAREERRARAARALPRVSSPT
jgi:apolipoprotein N-acyltransferase